MYLLSKHLILLTNSKIQTWNGDGSKKQDGYISLSICLGRYTVTLPGILFMVQVTMTIIRNGVTVRFDLHEILLMVSCVFLVKMHAEKKCN